MKCFNKSSILMCLLILTCFISIGYASLTTRLWITGGAHVEPKPYEGVYIKSVDVIGISSVNGVKANYVLPTNLLMTSDATKSGASITCKIVVHNNTDVTYWYLGTQYESNYNQNNLIGSSNGITIRAMDYVSDSASTFNSEDWVPPQTERTFYVVYTFGSNAQAELSTMVNFHFGIKMDAVHDEFLSVLNNIQISNSYESLAEYFDKQYAKDKSMYISSTEDKEIFASLFGDLTVNINGTEAEATVVIRRENLDKDTSTGDNYSGSGPKGCEYTLYITVDSLVPGQSATVYAIAYSCGASGMGDMWYQVGELYEGTAPVKSDGSIDYANWKATKNTYEIADGIKYNVGFPNGDQYDIMNTMEQLISAEDQDIFNDIDNTNIFKKVYDIIKKHNGSTDPSIEMLRQAFDDASIFYNNFNNGQEFKVVRNKYTRAEIIHALKKIQAALDYYYDTYGN